MTGIAKPLDLPAGVSIRYTFSVLAVASALSFTVTALPMLHLAANRLVVGTPVSAAVLGQTGWLICGLCLLGASCMGATRSRLAAPVAMVAFAMALLLFTVALGQAASGLTDGQPPATRARLASGAWAGLLLLAGTSLWAAGRTRINGAGWLLVAGLLIGFLLLHRAGAYDGLSLAVEYRAREAVVQGAVLRHIALSAAAVSLAAVSCVLLYAWRRSRGVVEIAINGLQVVPAVALLGGLVALASGLLTAIPALRATGLSALGPGPAILVIAGYLLLPFWRGLEAALRAADPSSLDAATAIGLTRRQILLDLHLPLGAPILVGALRVASVQAIGLATLGALVGAGGLGGIVFDGMAQFAPDLILLGALPVIGLSLFVERGLSLVEDAVHRRWRG
ncbi:ABC transporter permease subunit [Methylobacterium brachythecii]|uniref:ABC transporter permease n=1 Tax=Methylobacterium brachythecii TaxID=1176177 RepID=A0A7W6AMB4_9HYPH|nr:ABC transporter permease subunit [Methylobacterium brachythecii]MBB3902297.1 osmoprotectant transport system permease protein [Methylobacterium brachythecii]GLS42145.1 ABC transporter permease [Methylobacterium brachythecii]